MHYECAKDQILVNSVAPAGFYTDRRELGFCRTRQGERAWQGGGAIEMAEWIMMASSRATYATGENVVISGGYIYV